MIHLPNTNATVSLSNGDDAFYGLGRSRQFIDHGDGTLTDLATGLMWIADPSALAGDFDAAGDYAAALVLCEGLSHAGYTDWRMPNIQSLFSMVNPNLAVGPYIFSDFTAENAFYWSSTPLEASTAFRLVVDIEHAILTPGHISASYWAWPCRTSGYITESDPFTAVHNALLNLLMAYVPLSNMFKAGNRVAFVGSKRSPVKDHPQAADLPEIRLVPTGGTPHLQRTSNSSSCVCTWEIQISTGDQRVDEKLLPAEWAVYRAMEDWVAVLGALEWEGKTYVKLCRPQSIASGVSNADLNRDIIGWSTIWGCEVEMWFSTADL